MKIVEIIPYLGKRAGAEVFVLNLTMALNKNNQVSVICLYDDVDDEIEKVLKESDIRIYRCGKKKGIDFKCAKKLKEIIKSINPDVIHMHLNCISTYFLAFGFKKHSYKSFLTVHSLVEKDFRKLEILLLKQLVKRRIIYLIGISDSITNNIKTVFKKTTVFTIYNGTILFEPNKINEINGNITIVNVAAFRKEKNQKLLIDSFDKLSKKHKTIKLIFIGDGPLLQDCKKYASSLNNQRITFLGQQKNVAGFLRKADIFCLSSVYEGNPISILEAMSVGLPIVAPNVGGIPDVIVDNFNGKLFKPNDKYDLIKSLDLLISNPELRKSMRDYNIVNSKKYSIDVCSQNYLRLFKEMGENHE